jgi:hypothetical protein
MSDFIPELLRLMFAAIRKPSPLANRRTPIPVLPLRQSLPCEPLPWDPGRIQFTPGERQMLVWLWQELHQELGPETGMSESDVLCFALERLQSKLRGSNRQDVLLRLGYHLWNIRQ